MIVYQPKTLNFIPHIPIPSHLHPHDHPPISPSTSPFYSSRHGLHPHIINLKDGIHNRPPLNPRTLHQQIQPILPLPLLIPNPIVPKRPPRLRSKLLKLFTKGRRLKSRYATFKIREEGETAGLRTQGLELAGIDGESVGGAVAVGYWLG